MCLNSNICLLQATVQNRPSSGYMLPTPFLWVEISSFLVFLNRIRKNKNLFEATLHMILSAFHLTAPTAFCPLFNLLYLKKIIYLLYEKRSGVRQNIFRQKYISTSQCCFAIRSFSFKDILSFTLLSVKKN